MYLVAELDYHSLLPVARGRLISKTRLGSYASVNNLRRVPVRCHDVCKLPDSSQALGAYSMLSWCFSSEKRIVSRYSVAIGYPGTAYLHL